MNSVYVLQHLREDDLSEDVKFIGVFSSKEKAELAIKELSYQPGFRDYQSGFSLEEYIIDEVEWREGFGV